MSDQPKDVIAESLERSRAEKASELPRIEFHHYANGTLARQWVACIHMPDDELHCGDGATQCEALMMANIHWAMHGKVK